MAREDRFLTAAFPTLVALAAASRPTAGAPRKRRGRPPSGGLPTFSAPAGTFTGDSFLAGPEGRTGTQGLLRARGSLPTVAFLVEEEGGPLREALPALTALVASPPAVGSLVEQEGGDPPEGFLAVTALVRFLFGVGALMELKGKALAEGCPTVATF